MVFRTSKTLSLTSQLGSCSLLKSVGPISFIWLSESTNNAKLGGIKLWIASLQSFNAFTQIYAQFENLLEKVILAVAESRWFATFHP